MLFDLNSSPRRKRVVQIVFGGMAILFAAGFILFGVGGDVPGFLGGGGDTGSSNPEFESRIEDAQATLEANPKDEDALVELAIVSAQAGDFEAQLDEETGTLIITQASEDFYEDAISAWERYLALDPKRPDDGAAAQILNVYINSIQGGGNLSVTGLQDLFDGSVQTAAIFADAQPSANTYGTLAQLAYFAGDTEQGDEAATLAIEESESSEKKTTERLMEQYAKAGEQFQKNLAKAEKAQQTSPEEAFQNPLEDSLGGSGLSSGLTPPPPSP